MSYKFKAQLAGRELWFETKPGLFSWEHVDGGSKLLIENVQVKDGDIIADVGCGWGAIGLAMATLTPRGKVVMADVDIRAVEYAGRNAKLNDIKNVLIVASDGFGNIPAEMKFDTVVTNPPSHSPKQTLIEFIEGAKQRLKKGGKLYVVTERRLAPAIERDCKRVLGN